MKRVVLLTNQYLLSPHKAGFHWLAEEFWRTGWEVLFFTESLSWLSFLKPKPRYPHAILAQANRRVQLRERLASYVWLPPFHPLNLRSSWLNQLSTRVFSLYGKFPCSAVQRDLEQADLFVFDSDHGLFLFDRLERTNPTARRAYRVSDDIPMLRHHPLLQAQEECVASRFDVVSTPTWHIWRRFAHLANAVLTPHGLQTSLFDEPSANPYENTGPHVISVGRNYFDHDFLQRALQLFPQVLFHVFGNLGQLATAPNLRYHRERPFAELVPYLKHAAIGLQAIRHVPGAECFGDSLKMQQYTYCGLPIVAPRFLQSDRPHVFYYDPGRPDSIHRAMTEALQFDRRLVPRDSVHSWADLARTISAGAA